MSSTVRALALAAACCAVVGCGMAPRPLAPLRLQLSSPADGTRVTSDSVTVAGSVSPPSAASVLVVGQRVALTGGTFSARVAVQPGSNIIDVLAGAPHARATMTAVRVYRLLDVTVPDLSGDSPSAATRALHALGLQFRFHDEDGFFDFLLPNSPQVCGSSPPAGRSVEPGSVVTLSVAKTC